jgi:hypothetical protein
MMSVSDFVTLRGGLTLPLAAVRLAFDLEGRGLHLRLEGGGDVLSVGPGDRLTDADRALIRRWKPHLVAIVGYNTDQQERKTQ